MSKGIIDSLTSYENLQSAARALCGEGLVGDIRLITGQEGEAQWKQTGKRRTQKALDVAIFDAEALFTRLVWEFLTNVAKLTPERVLSSRHVVPQAWAVAMTLRAAIEKADRS